MTRRHARRYARTTIHRLTRTTLVAGASLAAACGESATGSTSSTLSAAVTAAFGSVPLGYANITSSYAGDADGAASLWLPGRRSAPFGTGAMMGGGMADAFVGGVAFGRGGFGHHGPFGGRFGGGPIFLTCTGSFNSAAGRFVCDPVTRDGLTISRSAAYTTTAGAVQQAFDSATTNTVNVRTEVSGTTTFVRDSSSGRGRGHGHFGGRIAGDTTTILTASTVVRHASDRTVGGLAQGSTQRTMNGTSNGQESTTGTSSQGAFTATRTAADTTRGLVIPISTDGTKSYPTAGTVIRVMNATYAFAGQAAASSSRREVVTYDGTATAKVVITKDGTTRNCTMPLPRGRLTCE